MNPQTAVAHPQPLAPVFYTRTQVEADLVDALRGILGCGVAAKALKNPSALTIADVEANLHLYERLGIAFVALGALRGYDNKPRGYNIVADDSPLRYYKSALFEELPVGTPFRANKPTESDSLIFACKAKTKRDSTGVVTNTKGFAGQRSFTDPNTLVWFCPMSK